MHVGLNLVYLTPGETGGMEVYARELVPALVERAPDLRLTAFVNRDAAAAGGGPWGELIPAVTVPVSARSRQEWVRGEQQHLPRMAKRLGVDLVHSLANTAPLWGDFRRVVTIHDLISRIHPEAHAGVLSLGMRVLIRLATRRSDRIIAISRNTRDDLVRLLGVPAERIDVVPQGVSAREHARPATESAVRAKFDAGDRAIVLSVSAKRPHKNIARLLEALARFDPEHRPVLVVPGYRTWHEDELVHRAAELGIAESVRFPGWLPDADLEGLYAAAACFVFPSLYEGFGLPVLEAMGRGVPVACSDRSSLPELASGAALLFDPESPAAIADAVRVLLTDRDTADRLRRAGRERAGRFTWSATADGVLRSYERACGR